MLFATNPFYLLQQQMHCRQGTQFLYLIITMMASSRSLLECNLPWSRQHRASLAIHADKHSSPMAMFWRAYIVLVFVCAPLPTISFSRSQTFVKVQKCDPRPSLCGRFALFFSLSFLPKPILPSARLRMERRTRTTTAPSMSFAATRIPIPGPLIQSTMLLASQRALIPATAQRAVRQ